MTQHGVARDHRFEWLDRQPDSCALVLTDNPATRSRYPFAFRLEVHLHGGRMLIFTSRLPSPIPEMRFCRLLSARIPAFCWPLLPGLNKQDYALHFSPMMRSRRSARLEGGLILATPQPTPIDGKILPLFGKTVRCRRDHSGPPGEQFGSLLPPTADRRSKCRGMDFANLESGRSPVGVPFLCIEPWHGFASPVEFDGEFHRQARADAYPAC